MYLKNHLDIYFQAEIDQSTEHKDVIQNKRSTGP